MKKAALLLLLGCLYAGAQSALSIDQLVSFVRSSVQLKHPDRKVAEYLSGVKLSTRLDERIIVELQAAGAGPRTVEALRALQQASKTLPEAPAPAAPPPPAPPIPPPSAAEASKIIEEVRDYALNYTKQLPDFICTQVTRRYYDPTGLEFWQNSDTLTARLSYFEQKEDYKLTSVNGHYTEAQYQAVGGAISSGEFGSMMKEIFEKETQTTFRWEKWATLRGHRMHVFSFTVQQPNSHWMVEYEKKDRITPGYQGMIYVDNDSHMVTRLRMEPFDIPASFPLQQVSNTLDYDLATIGVRDYMLPLRAEMRMRDGKTMFKNEVEFRLYRKFSADTAITFETPEPLSPDKTTEQPPKP
jgi:hypothetical protein